MVLSETTGADTIHYLHGLGLVAESDGTSILRVLNDGPVEPALVAGGNGCCGA